MCNIDLDNTDHDQLAQGGNSDISNESVFSEKDHISYQKFCANCCEVFAQKFVESLHKAMDAWEINAFDAFLGGTYANNIFEIWLRNYAKEDLFAYTQNISPELAQRVTDILEKEWVPDISERFFSIYNNVQRVFFNRFNDNAYVISFVGTIPNRGNFLRENKQVMERDINSMKEQVIPVFREIVGRRKDLNDPLRTPYSEPELLPEEEIVVTMIYQCYRTLYGQFADALVGYMAKVLRESTGDKYIGWMREEFDSDAIGSKTFEAYIKRFDRYMPANIVKESALMDDDLERYLQENYKRVLEENGMKGTALYTKGEPTVSFYRCAVSFCISNLWLALRNSAGYYCEFMQSRIFGELPNMKYSGLRSIFQDARQDYMKNKESPFPKIEASCMAFERDLKTQIFFNEKTLDAFRQKAFESIIKVLRKS